MRRIACLALLPLTACGAIANAQDIAARGSGNVRTYDIRDVTSVDLGGSDDIEVRVGGGYAMRAEGDPRILDKLEVRRKGNELLVSRRWSNAPGKVRIVVTLPTLTGAGVGGSGNMTVDRVAGGDLSVRVAGSGNLTLAQLSTRNLSVAVAGSGNVTARGTTQQLSADLAGSGDLNGTALVAQAAKVKVVGSGSVRAVVRGEATVTSVGSGDVDLGAGARCTVRKMGSGSVRCGG
ncbi:head GIN domain-containing protein [uncultured Sphingomonas sp.]|uniref:head GIN domain-containing protein n=1 Tax=uncultured Sphingomonas sp. TaxID=158754 RepID=UPI0025EF583F|nr:head GIN domain-containing protein [uncultured Sphingomonas sp.]